MYHAAQQGQLEALKFLVEKCKCKLTVASNDGAKPIHAAAQGGHTHVVQVNKTIVIDKERNIVGVLDATLFFFVLVYCQAAGKQGCV